MYKIRNHTSGFTLLELLIVITIIGLITTITLGALSNSRAKGRDAAHISDMRQLRNAIELYRTNNNFAPAGGGATDGGSLQALVTSNLISRIPADPNRTGNSGYFYRNNNTSSTEVTNDNNDNTYAIRFWMEMGTSFGPGGRYYCATSRGIEEASVNTCTQR